MLAERTISYNFASQFPSQGVVRGGYLRQIHQKTRKGTVICKKRTKDEKTGTKCWHRQPFGYK